jgi:hypothetical protein
MLDSAGCCMGKLNSPDVSSGSVPA